MTYLVIRDNDIQYSTTLAVLLTNSFPDIIYCGDDLITNTQENNTIILSSDADFIKSHRGFLSILISEGDTDLFQFENIRAVCRYSDIDDFKTILRSSADELDARAGPTEEIRLCCFSGNAGPAIVADMIKEEADNKLREGYIPVFAEFCPRHCLVMPAVSSGSANTLSDLMVRIMDCDVPPSELGLYMYPLENGSFRFRPFSKTDDIYQCNETCLINFINLLIDWNKRSSFSHYLFIFLSCVPFSYIYSAAALSGKLILINDEDPVRSNEFNKEMSSLLNNLPDSCVMVQCRADHKQMTGRGINV